MGTPPGEHGGSVGEEQPITHVLISRAGLMSAEQVPRCVAAHLKWLCKEVSAASKSSRK